ncbi:MAG: hypothetical protein HYZ52_00930 [Candidatus Omnitrophica bacterium]|nr:hypothetical protein [Candidatus Omnitrophota bacterium]
MPAFSPVIGIDLVEMKRARAFYRAHPERFSSAQDCAKSLAADEAVFKAYGRSLPKNNPPSVRFVTTKKFVMAQCVGIF